MMSPVIVYQNKILCYFVFRFDEDIHHVELDYPRDMSIWRGIGYHIDAAFQYKDGKMRLFLYNFINQIRFLQASELLKANFFSPYLKVLRKEIG